MKVPLFSPACLEVEGLLVRTWSALLHVDPDAPGPILLWGSYLPYTLAKHHPLINALVLPFTLNGHSLPIL